MSGDERIGSAAVVRVPVGTIYERMVEQVDQLAEDRIRRNAEIQRLRRALQDITLATELGEAVAIAARALLEGVRGV